MTKMLYPDWDVFNVTAETPARDRQKIFKEFTRSERAVLFNYDIISEGSDLDGASAVVLGRNVGQIKLIQIVGRVVRITIVDKEGVKTTKTLKIDDATGWQKFFGHIYYYLETQDPESSNYYRKLKTQLNELYKQGYSSIVEDSVVIRMPTTDENLLEDPVKFTKALKEDKKLRDKIKTEIHDIETMDNECKDYYEDMIFNKNLEKVESQLKKGNLDEAIEELTKAVTV
jgi:superfamily II DNA or RNA helicase